MNICISSIPNYESVSKPQFCCLTVRKMLVPKLVNAPIHTDMSVNKGVLPIINLLSLYIHLSLVFEPVDKAWYVTQRIGIPNDVSRSLVPISMGGWGWGDGGRRSSILHPKTYFGSFVTGDSGSIAHQFNKSWMLDICCHSCYSCFLSQSLW